MKPGLLWYAFGIKLVSVLARILEMQGEFRGASENLWSPLFCKTDFDVVVGLRKSIRRRLIDIPKNPAMTM
ncbi:hypothetical protein [Burkholderia stagnalis]|uniref:hypothetical protein n=1 Tax=Burkholderia stagnalis TaxID=1503054 RepID=UPI000F813993|nr:hypothetical protein [Burkholderia stagnalis]